MRVYLAGPLFSEAERAYLDTLAVRLRAAGFECFVPHEAFDPTVGVTPELVYRVDGEALRGSNLVLAWLDGPMVDDGTAAEIGAFAELARIDRAELARIDRAELAGIGRAELGRADGDAHRGIVGLVTDLRLARRRDAAVGDGMNLFVVGAIESCGRICWSVDDAIDALRELAR